jgi:hypothetical protein
MMKLKGHHYDTTEVIEAESRAVLNTLTEHDFQNAFKKWQNRWERCIRVEGAISRVMVTSRRKVSPRNCGWLFVYLSCIP